VTLTAIEFAPMPSEARQEHDLIPSAKAQEDLRDAVVGSIRNDGERETLVHKLFEELFSVSIEAAQRTPAALAERMSLEELARRMRCKPERVSQTRVRANKRLEELYQSGACRDAEFRLTITKGTLALRFGPHEPKVDYVNDFWAPYLDGERVVVYYPEPQFFKNEQDTYFRNHKINDAATKTASQFFIGKPTGLVPSQSFVPSGFVVALIQLFNAFGFASTRRLRLSAQRLRWAESMQEQQANVILMGTSSSVREIARTTDAFLMASHRDDEGHNAVNLPGVGSYVDHSYKPGDGLATILTKWVVVTRLRKENRFVTVFSGHSRAVEVAVKFFTGVKLGNLELSDVAKAFGNEYRFDGEFQILLGTDMTWSEGELTTRELYLGAVYKDKQHRCIREPDATGSRRPGGGRREASEKAPSSVSRSSVRRQPQNRRRESR
jgi:hypothetical protein